MEREGGAFGTELTGTLPAERQRAPVRFIGVDGPRWFLRGMLVGPAADPARAEEFEEAFRQIIVVRGNDPLPVREPVPLTCRRMSCCLPNSAATRAATRAAERSYPGLVGNRLSLRHRLTASTHRLDAAELESDVEKMPCAKMQRHRCG